MKVIEDTAILTENDEIRSRWNEYCEDWHLIEMVSAVRSKMRRPIGAAIKAVATNKSTKFQVAFLHKAQKEKLMSKHAHDKTKITAPELCPSFLHAREYYQDEPEK